MHKTRKRSLKLRHSSCDSKFLKEISKNAQMWLLSSPPALLSSSFHLCLVQLIDVCHNPSFSIKSKQTNNTMPMQTNDFHLFPLRIWNWSIVWFWWSLQVTHKPALFNCICLGVQITIQYQRTCHIQLSQISLKYSASRIWIQSTLHYLIFVMGERRYSG